jgi:multiple sugar transport system substrate-binding protein
MRKEQCIVTRSAQARRSLRRALPVALTAVLLATAGCGSGSSSPGSGGGGSDGKITLRLGWWGSDSRHAYTQKLIGLYESRHPNIDVVPDYSNFDDYWPKLSTAVVGGKAPDVLQQDVKYLREYGERGQMADLSRFFGKQIAVTDLDPSVAKAGEVSGKTYGIPTGVNAIALVADPAAFTRAGVQLPDDATWTWEQLASTAAAISKAGGKGFYGLQDPGSVDITLEVFAAQRGERLYTADGKLGVTRPTLVAYYSMLANLLASGATPPASLSVEIAPAGVDRSLVGTKKGAMAEFWTNQLSALSKAAGTELKLLRLPGDTPRPGTYFKPAMFWSMSSRSQHPAEAADLLDFLLNDPEVAKLTLSDRGLPTNLTNRTAILGSLKPADKTAAEFLDRIRPTIGATPALPPKGYGKVSGTVVKKTNEQILFKKMTPEQAADDFLAQANAALA